MAIALLAVALAGCAIVTLGVLAFLGRLPPNHFAGVRTRFTKETRENWYNTHRVAGPVFIFGGIFATAVALAFVPFAFADKISDTVALLVTCLAAGLLLGTVGAGWFAGTSYAAAAATREHPGGSGA
jgi:uncharacterized membrane protein